MNSISPTISEITQIWDRSLVKLQERLPDRHVYSAFFADTYIHSISNGLITAIATSSLSKTMLNTSYLDLIEEVVGEITQSNYKINFIEKGEITRVSEIISEQKAAFFKNSKVKANLTFDNFVVGQDSNLQAYQAGVLVANSPGKLYNPLFIYSDSGLGKTHLLHSIGNHIKQNIQNLKVLYVTADEFTDEYIRFVRETPGDSLKEFFRTIDVLLMDDVQFLANKEKTSEHFFHIFNLLVNSGKQIVITSDRHPSELKGLEDRLVTRFNSGLQINITKPDLETRKNILKKKIALNDVDINDFDDEVITFFAENFPNNVRELEGALSRLLFYVVHIAPTKHVTLEVALNSVQSIINVKDGLAKLTEAKIISVVADYYNLTPALIVGRNRTGQVALARHIAMYITRETLDLPFVRIGKAFGGKDHSTVINAIVKVENQLKTDDALKQAIKEIKERLQ